MIDMYLFNEFYTKKKIELTKTPTFIVNQTNLDEYDVN